VRNDQPAVGALIVGERGLAALDQLEATAGGVVGDVGELGGGHVVSAGKRPVVAARGITYKLRLRIRRGPARCAF